jgi:hypothetical protein
MPQGDALLADGGRQIVAHEGAHFRPKREFVFGQLKIHGSPPGTSLSAVSRREKARASGAYFRLPGGDVNLPASRTRAGGPKGAFSTRFDRLPVSDFDPKRAFLVGHGTGEKRQARLEVARESKGLRPTRMPGPVSRSWGSTPCETGGFAAPNKAISPFRRRKVTHCVRPSSGHLLQRDGKASSIRADNSEGLSSTIAPRRRAISPARSRHFSSRATASRCVLTRAAISA